MELSLAEARRLALSAQGFDRRSTRLTIADVQRLASMLLTIQLDSVNVLIRSHYLPVYSRLGPYPIDTIDTLAYDRRELFEGWGHATCLMPVRLYPLLRYRHAPIREMDLISWPEGKSRSGNPMVETIYNEVAERGPLTAAELSTSRPRTSTWWGFDRSKVLVETLVDCGLLAAAGRRGFQRLYDITERVLPKEVLEAPAPDAKEAEKQLLYLSAAAVGIGSARMVAGYLGLHRHNHRTQVRGPDGKWPRPIWPRLLTELVEDGRLVPVAVEEWTEPGYLVPGTRVPRSLPRRALLTPFDSFIRSSAKQMYGFTNPLAQQLYVPAERREYGYYVLPFLLGDVLVGRCDLKADRKRRALMVQAAYSEPGQDGKYVASELADELRQLQAWLELDSTEVAGRGNLAAPLRRCM